MTIPSVGLGDVIDEAWGNQVAALLNGLIAATSYTPTLTGMAIGTGGAASNVAEYVFVGGIEVGDSGLLIAHGGLAFGTSGATFPTSATISIPAGFNLTAAAMSTLIPIGAALLGDSGVSSYPGTVHPEGPTTVGCYAADAAATYLRRATVSTSVPFTWGAGDFIRWQFAARAIRV